ncbi:helix-turn-helix domain-containing protein [Caulobacter vibrioides]|uniref:helix-turn-helix domain-containing protein n=1 Tax=Caulobacter vibrioides TaxID=155892 RepID=UPI000BB4D6BD
MLRHSKGWSQAQAADAFGEAGISAQGWGLYEGGKRRGIFRPETQRKLTAALGLTLDDLVEARRALEGQSERPRHTAEIREFRPRHQVGELVIRDRVQAGAFLVADDLSQVEPRPYPAVRDARYPAAEQWLSQVVGDSVNLLGIVDGDLVHCVSAIDIGYTPRTGDIVEVERLRFAGRMRELTVKQVEVTADGVILWPRSTNELYRTPISLTEGLEEGEDAEVRIRGLVVGSLRRY